MSERIEKEEKQIIVEGENQKIVADAQQTVIARDDAVGRSIKSTQNRWLSWLAVLVTILLIGGAGMWWINSRQSAASNPESAEGKEHAEHAKKEVGHNEETGEHAEGGEEHGEEVELEPATLAAAGIELEGVTSRPAVARLLTTGTIENNPQNTQSVTPLVGGRVEQVNVRVGDSVSRGQVLAVVASPQIAQMHGKLHEAETALGIAERNYERVRRTENQVAVLAAKARLDEAEATLKRTRRLIELGAGAGKDLTAAETSYRTAKAEFDFQSNISLNREIGEARAAVETARVDVKHIRDEMRALGVRLDGHDDDDNHSQNTALVPVVAPAAGMVTERPINPGAGIEAGTTLFVLSNLSSVYAVASVPEAQMPLIRIGTGAEIHSPALGENAINARVTYIDPNLNEDTRTGRVRLEVANPGNRLRAGMFVEIGFNTGTNAATGEELVVPSAAIQRIAETNVVFVPVDGEPGTFKAETIEIGAETNGYTRIVGGLELGERVVTKGSFALKTAMQKGELGDHDH